MHTVMNVLHVLTAVFIVGPMAVLPMTAMRSLRAGDPDRVATLGRSTMLLSLLSLLVVIFGFGLLGVSDPAYGLSVGTTWVWLSLLLYAVALALNLGVVVPTLRSSASRLREPEAAGSGIATAYQRVASSSGTASLLLLVVVILMVWKP